MAIDYLFLFVSAILFVTSIIDILFCEHIKKKVNSFEVELEVLKRVQSNDTK